MSFPIFDSVERIEVDGKFVDLVVHRAVSGFPFVFHSPLTNGGISCALCESGTRVWLSGGALADG